MDNERELLLLGVLRRQEMHGYQLHEFIDNNMAACTDLKKPTAYYLLEKMASAGWIEFEQSQEGNRPPRRVYRITQQGEAAFQALIRANLARYVPARSASDVGYAFIDALPSGEAVGLLRQRRLTIEAAIESLRVAPPHAGGVQLVLDHQLRHLETELAWLDEVIVRLAAGAP